MDLRHLRYFLAVAEEQNFTRAAARLHISQPPLSQQIQQLEREMDVLLFHRTPVGAMLTQAGQRFASDAREILRLVDQAVLNAQRAARGELGTVRIGFTSSAAFHPFITGAVREFRSRHPNVGVELIETNTAMQLEGMRNGRIDVAFIRPAAGETASLHKLELFDEPMLVALPQAHRLAGHEKVRLRDLSEDDFVLYPRRNGRSMYDTIVAACRRAGFSPRVGQEAPQMASTVTLVAAGTGVSIVPESMSQLNAAGVIYRPIDGVVPTATMTLVWRETEDATPSGNFRRLVEERKAALVQQQAL